MVSGFKLKLKTKKMKILSANSVMDAKQTKVIAGGTSETETHKYSGALSPVLEETSINYN
ncbi:hypothetical protein CWB96_22135 [Pseudoalteromonas citrea]|uniref:Uncharacterized protein n=1 Tax=Pseudoalteromonas citrea TaxID=43655 RepID=A0A5S3XF56_9GAMM|nr:hypothetical protein CWB97_07515 [Pseudoalteromonas citrea]TMP51824.1 hypothetical protein CWB96_22135 [Pseudoalteromonas citrea]